MSEAEWEHFALEALAELEWRPVEGKAIAPGSGERETWDELVMPSRLLSEASRPEPARPDRVPQAGRSRHHPPDLAVMR